MKALNLRRSAVVLALSASFAVSETSAGFAETGTAKVGKGVLTVVVKNARKSRLRVMEAVSSDGLNNDKIASNVPGGKSVSVPVKFDTFCTFHLHAWFDDGAEADLPKQDLCKDKTVNLTD